MLKQFVKFTAKQLFLTPQQRMALTATEITVKGAKKIYKAKQEEKKRKELEEKIAYFSNRGFLKTLAMYIMGLVFSFFIIRWGWIGIILVLLGYMGHYLNLKEIGEYTSVTREKVLTWISFIGLVCSFFLL